MSFPTDFHITDQTSDLHIVETRPLVSPALLHNEFSLDEQAVEIVVQTRKRIISILSGDDHRLLVIVGPCSVHDIKAAKEYASESEFTGNVKSVVLNFRHIDINEIIPIQRKINFNGTRLLFI